MRKGWKPFISQPNGNALGKMIEHSELRPERAASIKNIANIWYCPFRAQYDFFLFLPKALPLGWIILRFQRVLHRRQYFDYAQHGALRSPTVTKIRLFEPQTQRTLLNPALKFSIQHTGNCLSTAKQFPVLTLECVYRENNNLREKECPSLMTILFSPRFHHLFDIKWINFVFARYPNH